MKILTLIIKQVFFDAIISGKKKTETRELRPKSETKYIEYDQEGNFDAKEFDAIRLYVGYRKDRDTLLVEVKNVEFEDLVDENNNPIELEENGVEYDAMNIVYQLGKVLEVNGVKQ